MLRSKPKLGYSGLTIVLSNPSRFDTRELLSANGGLFLNEVCLRPDMNRYQCDVRLKEDTEPLLPDTKAVLLLGEPAARQWLNDNELHLNEIGGVPYQRGGVILMASYLPQECVDFGHDEARLNPLSEHFVDEEWSDNDDDQEAANDKRRHGKTKRRNYGFWLMKDCAKLKHIMKHGLPPSQEPIFKIYPPAEEVIDVLSNAHDVDLLYDQENDVEFNKTCFAYSLDYQTVYVVPCLLPDYSWGYSALPQIYRALSIAIRNCTLVAHNGCNHDYVILARKYKIAIHKVYDTMVAMHRCYPEMEKSLGHCIRLWTNLPFHKDMGDVSYSNLTNAQQIWQYCGWDVYSMGLIKRAIDRHAEHTPGIRESIAQAMLSIRPYIIASLTGLRFNDKERAKLVSTNDGLMMQYIRWLNILIGEENLKSIRGKGKSSLASSNAQCVRYFHDLLGYPVISRGKERQDGTKAPSLGKKNLFKLRLKQENPVIDICLNYRELAKESGTMKFNPYKV